MVTNDIKDALIRNTTSKPDKRKRHKSNPSPQSSGQSNDDPLHNAALPPKLERQINRIMGWRDPVPAGTDSESDDADEDKFMTKSSETRAFKGVGFDEESKTKVAKKLRRARSRRSVKPISEREGDISAKMQMKMGLSYASFFTRIEELDSSDEDELKVRLSDGLRVWLKFGMNVTGNEQVI